MCIRIVTGKGFALMDMYRVSYPEWRTMVDDLVCISHLRWDFVWQRPQHLLSRLARNYRVFFIEEPVASTKAGQPRLGTFPGKGVSNVTVVRLIQPVREKRWIGYGDPLTQPAYTKLLTDFLTTQGINDPVLWLYTPMASEFVSAIPHKLLIFDVMDQLSTFKGAPADLVERDELLAEKADVVFTGGTSLYRDKRPLNMHTYLFPSGVETDHFAPASHPSAFERPADLEGISSPILGYFGVIDERMDLDLLAQVAERHPDWNIVLVGPVLKIDAANLPQAPNLHYLGIKEYVELPAYLAYFDVALIPFMLSEATRYLSPTKTLEYLAAHKPIVSTPIKDVIELYGDVVRVAHTPDEFIAQVEVALDETEVLNHDKEDRLLSVYTWDNIAQEMHNIIQAQLLAASPVQVTV